MFTFIKIFLVLNTKVTKIQWKTVKNSVGLTLRSVKLTLLCVTLTLRTRQEDRAYWYIPHRTRVRLCAINPAVHEISPADRATNAAEFQRLLSRGLLLLLLLEDPLQVPSDIPALMHCISMPVEILFLCIIPVTVGALNPLSLACCGVILAVSLMFLEVLFLLDNLSTKLAGEIKITRNVGFQVLCKPTLDGK